MIGQHITGALSQGGRELARIQQRNNNWHQWGRIGLGLASLGLAIATMPPASSPAIAHDTMPGAVAQAVLQRAAVRLNLPPEQLEVAATAPQIWPDGCLGLARPNEKCLGGEVAGWQLILSAQEQRYSVRSDRTGDVVRVEALMGLPPLGQDLPYSVVEAVEQASAGDRVRIRAAERHIWGNTCLDLEPDGGSCIAVPVPGWRITVEGPQVYHINDAGSLMRVAEGG